MTQNQTPKSAYEAPKLSRLGKIEEWTKGSVFAQVVQITVIAL